MFYSFMEVVQNFLYNGTVSADTYEYWLAVCISGVLCIMVLYVPFALVRWFFRGLMR